mgnify:CR=1 FL=1
MLSQKLAVFLSDNGLSQDYLTSIDQYFLPITQEIYMHYIGAKSPIVIGINGAQGSGKSTLADLMVLLLGEKFKLNCVSISVDDFYRTKSERHELSNSIHPLLNTRGVPGTHDISLAIKTINSLQNQNSRVAIPRFNKAMDDRLPEQQWDIIDAPIDIIVFEGWCLGAKAQTQDQLNIAINELERDEDENGLWRSYVNKQLKNEYSNLFSYIDKWIMLKAPSFDCVLSWRTEQEVKLRDRLGENQDQTASGCMTENELARFIQFYQRLTEDLIRTLPSKVDYLIELDRDRTIKKLIRQRTENEIVQQQKWLIFTDMDGTLLDHYSYSHSEVDKLLVELDKHDIPVIANTSKTFSEMLVLQKEFNNRHPFIIENGAAVVIPNDYFSVRPTGMVQQGDFWVKSFVQKRAYWQTIIGLLRTRYYDCFKTFSQLGPEQISELTGLGFENACRSSQRQYGEPIVWMADAPLKRQFIDELRELGANVLIGGRFMHVSGHTDKGIAMQWLCEQYQTVFKNQIIKSIAAGDSHNDVAMLERSDLAVLIRSPSHDLPVLKRTQGCYVSGHEGPKGWAESIYKLMKNYI